MKGEVWSSKMAKQERKNVNTCVYKQTNGRTNNGCIKKA